MTITGTISLYSAIAINLSSSSKLGDGLQVDTTNIS